MTIGHIPEKHCSNYASVVFVPGASEGMCAVLIVNRSEVSGYMLCLRNGFNLNVFMLMEVLA